MELVRLIEDIRNGSRVEACVDMLARLALGEGMRQVAKSVAQIGAAGIFLGVVFAGLQPAVASADSGVDSADREPSAAPAASSPGPARGVGQTARRQSRPVAKVAKPSSSTMSSPLAPRPTMQAPQSISAQMLPAAPVAETANLTVSRRSAAAPLVSSIDTSSIETSSIESAGCAACWGAQAPAITQSIATAVNHLFNSAFTLLSGSPTNIISDLVGGALVLVRRALFLIPEGVTTTSSGSTVTVSVNTGSTAYFRQDSSGLQVSGDPWFFGATTVATSSDTTVSVVNPGNAGCAGVVVTSGQVLGDLQTAQIDSLRFGADASVSGKVSAAVSDNGVLTLRDAVRADGGASFDARVLLANDVSVDAGDSDVTFNGTVDAATAGAQSLVVTALGTTTFAAAVGSQNALRNLLTQGINPLLITQSVDTVTIPLDFLPEFNTTGQAQVKYGIDVAIGNNPSQVYEFDTGGIAFFAGYNSAFWRDTPLTTIAVSEGYSSGNNFNGVIANTGITLGKGAQTVSTGQPIQIAAILNGGNATKGTSFDFTNPDAPPIEDHFFGDFGASFATLPVPALSEPLANPLFQLPGNLSSGFVVQLGPIGIAPQLTVGLTDDLREQFTYAVPVTPAAGGGTYPVSGYPELSWFGFSPSYSAQQGDQEPQQIGIQSTLPSLIDSGAPSTGIRTQGEGGDPYNDSGQLQPGTTFIAHFPTAMGRPPLKWTFVAGNNGSVSLVNYQQGEPGGIPNVNTGLNLYNQYDIAFDVAAQVIWLRPTGAQATVDLQSVTTTGSQTYRQNANLAGSYIANDFSVGGVTKLFGNTVINVGTGDVSFYGTVDAHTGIESLAVNGGRATTFVRGIGNLQALSSVSVTSAGPISTASVVTSGSQSYTGSIALNGWYSVAEGVFTIDGATTLAGPTSISGGDITFNGQIDSAPNRGYQLGLIPGAGRVANLNGDIGVTDPLGGLTVEAGGAGLATVVAPHYVALAGNLGFSSARGLSIDNGVTAKFTGGGLIQDFADSGVVVGQSIDSAIANFAINGNGINGVQLNGSTNALVDSNIIINNVGDGVVVSAGDGNRIHSNSIFGNGGPDGLGIHLQDGGNNDQPAPSIQSASLAGENLSLAMTVEPAASGPYTVQVFYSPASSGPSIQGQQLVQTLTDVEGHVSVTIPAPTYVTAGGYITVTSTSSSGDTSQFSSAAIITNQA